MKFSFERSRVADVLDRAPGTDVPGLVVEIVVLRVGDAERAAHDELSPRARDQLELEPEMWALPAFAIVEPASGWKGRLAGFTRRTVSWMSSYFE